MKTKILLALLLFPRLVFPQSDIDRVLKGGELILSGLTILRVARSEPDKNSKTIESVCVKNKLNAKITFRLTTTTPDEQEIKREVVVQKNGKECVFEIPKGIYTYEILLANDDVYKKGEYKFEDSTTFTVKEQ